MSKRLREFDGKISRVQNTEAVRASSSQAKETTRFLEEDDEGFDVLIDSIEDSSDELDLRSQSSLSSVAVREPVRKRPCVSNPLESSIVEKRRVEMEEARLRLANIKEAQYNEALHFARQFEAINKRSFGRYHHIVDALNPGPYIPKKKALFNIVLNFGNIIIDNDIEILDSNPDVQRVRAALSDIFIFNSSTKEDPEERAIEDSERKRAYGAFLKVTDWEPKFGSKPAPSKRPHPFDCITGTDLHCHMEVMPGKTKALHAQCCLEVFYEWDGNYFQVDCKALVAELAFEGITATYNNVKWVKTDEYDSLQYVHIPNSQKTEKQRQKVMEKAGVPSGEASSSSMRRFK